ncbi:MAG: hypothetical protein ABSF69_29005 [Polyangiaceae bacterium]
MGLLPCVLDTNIARFGPPCDLEKLARRGFRLRVAETAFLEWIAACVREWQEARWSRPIARQKFFGRAKSIAPFLDSDVPVALDGGLLTRRIVAQADGKPAVKAFDDRQQAFVELWRRIVGLEMTDEEFIAAGQSANAFLDELDANFIDLARGEEELRKRVPPAEMDAASLSSAYAQWDEVSDMEKFTQLCRHAITSWRLSPVAAERLDAHVCTTAYRLQAAARKERMPKRNDGADASLTIHLGSGSILLTKDEKLIDVVDRSGTFQAQWVRHPDDLDNPPYGLPWGDDARRSGSSFRRRK